MPAPGCILRAARLSLLGFVLALITTVASPIVQARAAVLVCSASGASRLLVPTGDGWGEMPAHDALHCPLCLLAGGGAPCASAGAGASPPPRGPLLASAPAPRLHRLHEARAPMPPRGPPRQS